MKNEDKPNFPMDKNDEIQSSSKKRKEHPVDMLANKTKTELLAEAHSAGIKGRHKMRKELHDHSFL
jgi:hypothetical protein